MSDSNLILNISNRSQTEGIHKKIFVIKRLKTPEIIMLEEIFAKARTKVNLHLMQDLPSYDRQEIPDLSLE